MLVFLCLFATISLSLVSGFLIKRAILFYLCIAHLSKGNPAEQIFLIKKTQQKGLLGSIKNQ